MCKNCNFSFERQLLFQFNTTIFVQIFFHVLLSKIDLQIEGKVCLDYLRSSATRLSQAA